MNPRQRRGALLIGVSIVGALAIAIAFSSFVAEVEAQRGPLVEQLVLVQDLPAFTPVSSDVVDVQLVPEQYRPPGALPGLGLAEGQVSRVSLPAGTFLQSGMLEPPSEVDGGLRELAILVDAETGVAGQIRVGDHVDIIATRSFADAPPTAEIVLQDVVILNIGITQQSGDTLGGDFVGGARVPVTFALAPDDILRLAWVESFAGTVRLALRNPQDTTTVPREESVFQPFSVDAANQQQLEANTE